MKKIRCYLAIVALIATLSVPALQGIGSVANAASSHYASSVSAPSVAGKSLAFKIGPPCGSAGDC
jgi:hypothetical protein